MSDLKPQLMQDAQVIVQQHREAGGDLNAAVAKYASDKGYSPKVVDALSACVNRHSFKTAMEAGGQDEPAIASPAAVKLAQSKAQNVVAPTVLPVKLASRVRENERSKTASVTTVSGVPFDYGPALRVKLQREKIACESRVQLLRTDLRLNMEKAAFKARLIKQVGLEKTAQFQELLSTCPGHVAAVFYELLEKSAAKHTVRDGNALAMLVPQALQDFELLKAACEDVVKLAHAIGLAEAQLLKVNDALQVAQGKVIAHV